MTNTDSASPFEGALLGFFGSAALMTTALASLASIGA